MSHLGFCISYDKVTRYKQSVILSENHELTEYLLGTFTQWAADNIDHKIMTVLGQGIFYGMGVVAISTPDAAAFIHNQIISGEKTAVC